MTNAIGNVQNVKSGCCPHGLPPSACPVCSNMGSGGGRVGERPQKAGEMSYHQCAMIGAFMKAREENLKAHEKNMELRKEALLNFKLSLETASAKMIEYANKLSQNFLLKPAALFITHIAVPTLNIIKNIPNILSNIRELTVKINNKFIDIQDKLNAMFGEAKAFIEKKVSELVSSLKNTFKSLFKISKKNNTKNDDKKIEEDKKIFNLKTTILKILNRKKNNDSEDKSRP